MKRGDNRILSKVFMRGLGISISKLDYDFLFYINDKLRNDFFTYYLDEDVLSADDVIKWVEENTPKIKYTP